ncbi:putative transferase, protein kinase RLK-Pelle-LRR-I-1 family [Helianthus annuus]|uniref:Putative fibroblast growth factor receptor family n=1 Tax=Helianthus annuus TaxID=4232 RepID=A0A251T9V8_HELAN|nr:putative transferase, protein kinase RLK-Pelle-LRR-I-1 family [Helianthus annuus]KAJ0437697.1 putative transferase, protein kinase RLK-Pelle-LRR-I-1 family [Helianthus annuus]KAJ0460016.1 putative transferase, protein kinase RLK-Pelle-LRR-I-1 family [Helianthus annuus]
MSVLKDSRHQKIPLKEIEIATKNFLECIGKGGYGMVYKGELLFDGKPTTVAVKRLNEQFGQGLKEFLIEIQLLTSQNHPNLISLIGYCDEGKEKIIVYEYAEHGSLDQYLRRLDRSAVVSHACGTRGYCEPEYFSTGIVKKESDVYSFGMVLYEVFCGKLCLVDDGTGFLLSGPLAKDYYLKKKVSEIVDPGVRAQMSLESMNKFATIAYYCLHDDRGQRPTMDLVAKELDELLQIQVLYI